MDSPPLSSRSGNDGDFPPRPKEWRLTLADLTRELKAGKRASIAEAEIRWAQDYERSLLPPGMRFPQPGDVYQLLEELAVDFTMELGGMGSVGGRGLLIKGDRVYMSAGPADPGAFSVALLPFDRALEDRLIAENASPLASSGGIYLHVTIVELNQKCLFVQSGHDGKGMGSYGIVIADRGPGAPRSIKKYGPDPV